MVYYEMIGNAGHRRVVAQGIFAARKVHCMPYYKFMKVYPDERVRVAGLNTMHRLLQSDKYRCGTIVARGPDGSAAFLGSGSCHLLQRIKLRLVPVNGVGILKDIRMGGFCNGCSGGLLAAEERTASAVLPPVDFGRLKRWIVGYFGL